MAIISFDPRTHAELDGMRETMKMLEKLGAVVKAANLNAKERVDGDKNNAQILKYLAEGNSRSENRVERDFISMGSAETQKAAQAYINEVAKETQKQANRNATMVAKGKRTQTQIDAMAAKQANQAATKGYYAAMDVIKEIISDRIKNGRVADGSSVEDITKETKKSKRRDHNHVYPIGNATGQVLENLTPGKSNVKITRN